MQAEIQLLRAAKKGNLERVRSSMRACKTLNCRDQNGYTALHWAAAEGHLRILRALLQSNRVNVQARTKSGATALHWASGQGSLEAVKQLLVNKANPQTEDDQGETPLFWSCTNGHPQIVNVLLVAKANPAQKDRDGLSVIEVAQSNEKQSTKHGRVLKMLLNAKARRDRAKEAYRVLQQQRERAKTVVDHIDPNNFNYKTKKGSMGPPRVHHRSRGYKSQRGGKRESDDENKINYSNGSGQFSNTNIVSQQLRQSLSEDRAVRDNREKQLLAQIEVLKEKDREHENIWRDGDRRKSEQWENRERELLSQLDELKTQQAIEIRNSGEQGKEVAVLRDREGNLLSQISEIKAELASKKQEAEDHNSTVVSLRQRETKLLAEVAELEIHNSTSKGNVLRLKQEQEQEIELIAAGFKRKITSLQQRLATSKGDSARVDRLEKSLKEATHMIRNQQAQLEAQNKVAAMHAEISSAAQNTAAVDAETIDRVSKEAEQLRRQIETLESSHRRDMAELTDDCDARISQMEKEALALVEKQSRHDQKARDREIAAARAEAEEEVRKAIQMKTGAVQKVESKAREKLNKIESKLREVEAVALQWETNCKHCESLIIQERQQCESLEKDKNDLSNKLEDAALSAKTLEANHQEQIAEIGDQIAEVERHAEEQLAAAQKKFAAKQERYNAKIAEMKRQSKKVLKSVEGHQHGSAKALKQLTVELEESRMQEATLFEELQTIHAQYSTRDEQLQQTAAMKAETCAMEHQQQLQEQKLQISTAAEAKIRAAEEKYAQENAMLKNELKTQQQQIQDIKIEYTKAEEQMQAYALSLEKKQSETIREAEVRAQAVQGQEWEEQLRELRRKLEDDAAAAAKHAEKQAKVELVERERKVQERCQEVFDREVSVFETRIATIQQQHQQDVAVILLQHKTQLTQAAASHRTEMEEMRTNLRRRRDADAQEWRKAKQVLDARVEELQQQLSAKTSSITIVGEAATQETVVANTDLSINDLTNNDAAEGTTVPISIGLHQNMAAHKSGIDDISNQFFKDQTRSSEREGQTLMDDLMRATAEVFDEVPVF